MQPKQIKLKPVKLSSLPGFSLVNKDFQIKKQRVRSVQQMMVKFNFMNLHNVLQTPFTFAVIRPSYVISHCCYPTMGYLWGYLVCCVCFLFVCTVTGLSAAEKIAELKLCMLVRLLSGMSFCHFGELWLAWSHGGSITSGM